MRKLDRTSYLKHKTNDLVQSKINFIVGPWEPFLTTVKRQKVVWFRYVTRHYSLSKTIHQGTLEGGRRRRRQRRCWPDNIKDWTYLPMPELLTRASGRKGWKMVSVESSLMTAADQIGQGTEPEILSSLFLSSQFIHGFLFVCLFLFSNLLHT